MDYEKEVQLSRSRIVRMLFFALGTLFLLLGLIGVILPVLPTTPFLLLTAACYARSSHRFYNWLLNNRFVGGYLQAWRYERRIPLRAKVMAFFMITLAMCWSILFVIPLTPVKVLVAAIGISVILYINHFPD